MEKVVNYTCKNCGVMSEHGGSLVSRQQLWILALASSSLVITILLLPITVNISTGYISALSPWVDDWIRGHVLWFLVTTIILSLLIVIPSVITAYLELIRVNTSSLFYSNNEGDVSTPRINAAVDMAIQDAILTNHSNQFSMLRKWKGLVEELLRIYKYYEAHRHQKDSKNVTIQMVASLEKLIDFTCSRQRTIPMFLRHLMPLILHLLILSSRAISSI